MSNSDETKLLLLLSNNNDKILIKQQQQQQKQQTLIDKNNNNNNISKHNNKEPPVPPPLPIFIKMNNNEHQQQQLKYRSYNHDEDFFSIYNQKPKIIKYTTQGTTTATTSTTTPITLTHQQQQRIYVSNRVNNHEIIQNNAKNSYYLSEQILNNIDNISSNEKLIEKMIISKQGTVRGNLNHVKISLKQFFKENFTEKTLIPTNICCNDAKCNYLNRDFESEEINKIVIYTTSIQIVRQSHAKCKRVKKILQNHCVRYEERDLYKNKDYQRELKYRLNLNSIDVPYIFFNGKLIGNCDQLEALSDQGYLNKLFKDLEKIRLRIYCSKCGGYRFVLCTLCNGSKKIYNNFTTLKCTTCNEDGLMRCDTCLDQQE